MRPFGEWVTHTPMTYVHQFCGSVTGHVADAGAHSQALIRSRHDATHDSGSLQPPRGLSQVPLEMERSMAALAAQAVMALRTEPRACKTRNHHSAPHRRKRVAMGTKRGSAWVRPWGLMTKGARDDAFKFRSESGAWCNF